MQEDVEQRTIALSVRTARMTSIVLQQALRKFLDAQKHKTHKLPHGKQTLKELMKQNTGVSSLEVNYDNIKDFEATAKKYGIDFALKKDAMENPPRYIVFFKGRDADVMTQAFKEYTAMSLNKEKKPSIKKTLAALKEQAEKVVPHKEKVKVKERGMEL